MHLVVKEDYRTANKVGSIKKHNKIMAWNKLCAKYNFSSICPDK